MKLSHTLDIPKPTIPESAEAVSLSSVKRPDPENPGKYKILESNLKYPYGHWIVEKADGTTVILMVKDMDIEQKKKLANDPQYKRILHCDVLGN